MTRAVAVLLGTCVCLAAASFGFGAVAAQSRLAPFEPPDGFAYHGMFIRLWESDDPRVGDSRPFGTRLQDSIVTEMAGKSPAIMLVPTTWQTETGDPIPFANALDEIRRFESFGGRRITPFLKWNAQSGWEDNQASYRGIMTKDVAAGSLDTYIRQYARDVRAWGRPIFISPVCAEFNGNWWRSCSPLANPAITHADFTNSWRRVVELFRQEGATNVAWVWNPVLIPDLDSIEPYWPGDNFVDWAGIDHYDKFTPADMEPAYRFAVAHGKPFFIGEWGVRLHTSTLNATQQQQWLEAMFAFYESHPKVKAIVYYNYNQRFYEEDAAHMAGHVNLYEGQVNYHPHRNNGDSRLLAESGAAFRATYARRISHPRYLSEVSSFPAAQESSTQTPRPSPTPSSTSSPRPTLVPTVSPTSSPTPLAPTATPQIPEPAATPGWLLVQEFSPALSLTEARLWDAAPGEWYRVLGVESGWALARWEFDTPEWVVWIELDGRVLLTD
jgi:hypothetical protein